MLRFCRRATIASLVLLVACGRSGAPQLQGKWKGTKVDGVSADVQKDANAFAGQIELDVKGDVITVTYPKDQKQSGHYTVKRADKTALVITADKDGPGAEETFTFPDDKTLKWTVESGRTITFARQ